ncbi:MAG: CdaA regulatory protein CdaR [Firmicutes bacterium]|nr:CdaA regulatory protein CdaR [candidate division NPL-UPA2 bacterium]MBT9155625.1 CdaA regulatory protein CdaR [candidate division NPL-UPA2 bacterium]
MRINRTDIGTHILALVLALVLWFFVMYTQSPTGVVELHTRRLSAVTLEVRNRPVGLSLVRQPTAAVTLTVRGPRQALDGLQTQDVVAFVDLAGLKEGTHQLGVRVALPSGVEAVSSAPTRVEVALDQIISVTVPVKLLLEGSLPAGYFAPPSQVTPSSVVVTGGRSAVARLAPLVIRLDASGLTTSLAASAELNPLDVTGQRLPDVSLSAASIEYHQPVYPTKSLPIRLETQGQPGSDIKEVRVEIVSAPESPSLQATLAAPSHILHGLTELVILIDVTGITANTTVEATPIAPLGAYLVSPPVVNVHIIVGSPR